MLHIAGRVVCPGIMHRVEMSDVGNAESAFKRDTWGTSWVALAPADNRSKRKVSRDGVIR